MGRCIPFFGAASRADGDTRFGVSLRCIQNQDRRCLVPAGVDMAHDIFSLIYRSLTTASLEMGEVHRDLSLLVISINAPAPCFKISYSY